MDLSEAFHRQIVLLIILAFFALISHDKVEYTVVLVSILFSVLEYC